MFSEKESPIHHGFLRERKTSFTVLISIIVQSGTKDGYESLFDALESNQKILNQEEYDRYMIEPYLNNGNFSGTHGLHPEKEMFPP